MNYFNLGEAIAFLGIVIAVYGIVKPKWRLNFYFNRRMFFSVMGLVILGLLSSFTAFIFAAYTKSTFYSSLFQGLTFVFFVCATVDFIRGVFWRKPLYLQKASEKSRARFAQRILDEALFNEESLDAVITIIRDSLDEICKEIKAHDSFRSKERTIAAYLLETFLGESKVINHIVERRLDFISRLVSSTEKNYVRDFDLTNGIGSLITALYVNPKSYFYQQIGYMGLANYASIYSLVFENQYFVKEFNPIARWYGIEHRVNYKDRVINNEDYVKTFLKGFTISLEKFGYEKPSLTDALARGMYQLSEYAKDVSMDVQKLPEYDYFAPANRAIGAVIHFVGHDFYYDILSKKAEAGHIKDNELSPRLDAEKYREGLSEAFSSLFVDLAESIEIAYGKTEMERHEVIMLNDVFVNSIGTYPHTAGIRKKILHELWAKSEDNITKGYFPVAFRALAIMLYWQHSGKPKWAQAERNRLIDTLRTKVKPRILKNELMFDDKTPKEKALLPACIIFDKKAKKFYTVDSRGNRRELRKQ